MLDIALDTLSLGRAALALGDTGEATAQVDAAVTALEDAGASHHIPRGLLARAALHRVTRVWDLAAEDLNATDEIADRSGLKPFQIDSALSRARLTLARDGAAGVAAARALLAKAQALIDTTRTRDHEGKLRHYALPTPDMALIEARLAILAGTPDSAQPHLAEARRWIEAGWRAHVPEHAELTALAAGKAPPDGGNPSAAPAKSWWQRLFS